MLNKKAQQDTFKPAIHAIAQRVLASPLAGCLKRHTRLELEDIVAHLGESTMYKRSFGSSYYLTFAFEKAGTSIDVYLQVEGDRYGYRDPVVDDAGNEWIEFQISCQANWPSHGGESLAIALARLNFYRDATTLGAEIEAEFCGRRQAYWTVLRTAEEIAAQKAAELRQNSVMNANGLMQENRRNMQVGATRVLTVSDKNPITDGLYEFTVNDKKYALDVRTDAEKAVTAAILKRTA